MMKGKAIFVVILASVPSGVGIAQEGISAAIQSILIPSGQVPVPTEINGVYLHEEELAEFYSSNDFVPLWRDEQNRSRLLTVIREAEGEGLLPSDYHYPKLVELHSNPERGELLDAHFDLLLSDAFLTLARHVLQGKVNPELLFPGKWERTVDEVDIQQLLAETMREGNPIEILERLRPQLPGYQSLIAALKSLQKSDTSLVYIPEGQALEERLIVRFLADEPGMPGFECSKDSGAKPLGQLKSADCR